MIRTNDPFLGYWVMDAAQNVYDVGVPPTTGSYRIEAEGDAYKFTMETTNSDGQSHELVYYATRDGIGITHGRRVLSDDGQTMFITQSGSRTDSTRYENRSVYYRKG